MAEPISTTLASIAATLKAFSPTIANFLTSILPTTFGALLSMYVYKDRKWYEQLISWAAAIGLAHYGVGAAAEYFNWKEGFFLNGCRVFVGIYGLAIVMEMAKQVPLGLAGLRAKITGGQP
jgi:hypothetical protein